MSDSPIAPEGWYADPRNPSVQRYWNGTSWTDRMQTAPAVSRAAAPASSAPAATQVAPVVAYNYAGGGFQGASGRSGANVLAFIALAVAVIGFIFACLPGALIVGWILLPIAFVLSIIALFLRGRGKWAAIVGLVVTIVGIVVGFGVFFNVVSTAFDTSFGSGGDTSVVSPSDEDGSGGGDAAAGSREDPVPFDSVIENDDWTVSLTGLNPDANAAVEKANMFNEDPPKGKRYIIVGVSATYNGADEGLSSQVQIDYVTSKGTVISTWDSSVAGIEPAFGQAELYAGGTDEGRLVFLVPSALDGVIRVQPGMLADEVFLSLP